MSSVQSLGRRSVVAVAVLAVLAGLAQARIRAALYGAESKAGTPRCNAAQAMPVPVAVVDRTEVNTWDEFSGSRRSSAVDVRSRVAGAVKSVHFTEGALVKKDDLLITIDPDPYAAEVERAQAQVVAAARVSYTKSERERACARTRARSRRARRAHQRGAGGRRQPARLKLP